MIQDYINGAFELIGSWFVWRNVWQLYCDKKLKGVYWPTVAFFSAWGIWNLFYYPSLAQWASLIGGVLLTCGNIIWVLLAIKYKND